MSLFMCHVSRVTFHMSYVTCHISCVTYEAYWWRVCYQRGLPRLVFNKTAFGLKKIIVEGPNPKKVIGLGTSKEKIKIKKVSILKSVKYKAIHKHSFYPIS